MVYCTGRVSDPNAEQKSITVALPMDMWHRLETHARKANKSKSEIVRALVNQFCEGRICGLDPESKELQMSCPCPLFPLCKVESK